MIIKKYEANYFDDCLKLFHDTVHQINTRDYTEEQVDAWAPSYPDVIHWNQVFEGEVYLCLDHDRLVGFADLAGCVFDHLYVHKDVQRQGVATMLAEVIEDRARALGCLFLETDASITAKEFFLNRGYVIIKKQRVVHNNVAFINYHMRLNLED